MNGYTQPGSARPRSSNLAIQLQKQSHNLRKFAGREGGKRTLNHGDTQDAARAPAQVTQPLNFKNSHTTFANSQVRKGASANSLMRTLKMLRAPPLKYPSHSTSKNSHTTFANSQVGKGASAHSTIVTLKMLRAPPLKIEQAHH